MLSRSREIRRIAVGVLVVAASLSWTGRAFAQPSPADSVPVVVAPVIEQFVEAEYPDEALAAGLEGSVLLELTIERDGSVSEVVVVESTDAAFEDPAAAAAAGFRFVPASKNGEPVAARIRYRYTFDLEPEPEHAADDEDSPSGEQAAVTERPTPPTPGITEVTVFGDAADEEPREPTRRTLRGETLGLIPGTRGDALRAIEVLPGVAQTTDGEPRLRGSAADESQVFFGSVPVPVLFHFGGITGVFQSKLLERIDYYPGNFSVKYGRVSGGVIDVGIRNPRSDGFHAVVDASLLHTAAVVESPVGPDTAVAAAARRSNIDFYFRSVAPSSVKTVAAPVYWDYQSIVSHRVGSRHHLRLVAYGSQDSLRLVLKEPDETDPALRGRVAGELGFHRVQLHARSRLSKDAEQTLMVSYGHTNQDFVLSSFRSRFVSNALYTRGEWRARVHETTRLTFGIDTEVERWDGLYFGPRPPQNEGDPAGFDQRLTSARPVGARADTVAVSPAGYLEAEIRPVEPLTLIPGVRLDYFEQIAEVVVDPRLALRYAVTDDTTVKSGVGTFTQRPIWWRSLSSVGNPSIEPHRALHTSAGVEQSFGEHVQASVEGFYKKLVHRIVGAGSEPPYFVNDGVGRVYGAEVSLEARPTPRTFAYLAYTVAKSQRRDGNGPWRAFDYDQRHNLSLAGNYELGRGWEIGARFRLVTGRPETPIVGGVYDGTTGSYLPIHGETNSRRLPTFHQLDLRGQKTWTFETWKLAVYLDIMNTYNSTNPDYTEYSFDYSESERVSGLPFFPNFGIRGEL